jgi:hypothetical protein
MAEKLGDAHNHRGIEPLQSHAQLLWWELLIFSPIKIQCLRRVLDRFHMVDLLVTCQRLVLGPETALTLSNRRSNIHRSSLDSP